MFATFLQTYYFKIKFILKNQAKYSYQKYVALKPFTQKST